MRPWPDRQVSKDTQDEGSGRNLPGALVVVLALAIARRLHELDLGDARLKDSARQQAATGPRPATSTLGRLDETSRSYCQTRTLLPHASASGWRSQRRFARDSVCSRPVGAHSPERSAGDLNARCCRCGTGPVIGLTEERNADELNAQNRGGLRGALPRHFRLLDRRRAPLQPGAAPGEVHGRRWRRYPRAPRRGLRGVPDHRQHRHGGRDLSDLQAALRSPLDRIRDRACHGVHFHRDRDRQLPRSRHAAPRDRWGRRLPGQRCESARCGTQLDVVSVPASLLASGTG